VTPGPYALRGVLIILALVALGALLSTQSDVRAADAGDSEIRLRSIIGGQTWRAGTGVFRGGTASTIMGGVDLDMRQARIEGESVVLDIHVMMGGVHIRVPEEWMVVTELMPILGGVRDQTRPPAVEGPPELIIRGSILMGGLYIRN